MYEVWVKGVGGCRWRFEGFESDTLEEAEACCRWMNDGDAAKDYGWVYYVQEVDYEG